MSTPFDGASTPAYRIAGGAPFSMEECRLWKGEDVYGGVPGRQKVKNKNIYVKYS